MARSRRSGSSAERFVTTVLFTDIVGSTELADELGDRRWRDVLAMHHAVVRRHLKRNGGREVDTAGDGFFATFDQPTPAVRCASDVADELWANGLKIRAGIHFGEVERTGAKVGGMAVHIGARVASTAEPGEVRVSSTVRDLVVGSHLGFLDRGICTLKGVPGEWRLFAVTRESAPTGVPAEAPPALSDVAAASRPWYRRPAIVLPAALALLAGAVGAYALTRPDRAPVVDPGPNTVARFDPQTNAFVEAIGVGNGPSHVAFGDGKIWVLNPERRTMTPVDAGSGEALDPVSVDGTPTDIAYGDNAVWVAAGFGLTSGAGTSVLRFDARTLEAPATIEIEGDIHSIAYGFGAIWTTSKNRNSVTRIDAGTRSVVEEIPVGEGPEGIAVGAGAVWVANSLERTVSRIDPGTNEAQAIDLGESPNVVAATDQGIWVGCTSANALVRIDPDSRRPTTIALETAPSAITATDEAVWVVAAADRGILRVDAETREAGQLIRVRGTPSNVTIGGSDVWVTIR